MRQLMHLVFWFHVIISPAVSKDTNQLEWFHLTREIDTKQLDTITH